MGTMRTIIASLLAGTLLSGLAGSADAATTKKKRAYGSEQSQARKSGGSDRAPSENSRPEDLPVGSSEWWRAMERENRAGNSSP